MKRALACLAVAAAAATLHAQSGAITWFDLPVSGSEPMLAATGVVRADRAHALALAARMPSSEESKTRAPASSLGATADEEPFPIPAPLTPDAWRDLLELKRDDNLPSRLLADGAATRLASGFTSTDASVRELALRDRGFVRHVYRDAPGAFAAFARSVRIEGGRVVVPGGQKAEKIWEELADAPPTNPAKFITVLLTKDEGRLGWYFDTLATLGSARLEHAWPDGAERERLDNARALYESFRRVELRWRVEEQPFRRTAGDPWMVLNVVDLRDGVVAGPPWTWFWEALVTGDAIDRSSAERVNRRRSAPVSLAWIARAIAPFSARERRERFDMLRLAQRMFPVPREADAPDLLIALSGYRRYKAILLTLERMRIASPPTWAALIEAARQVDRSDGDRIEALASFQGAFALVARLWHVGTLGTNVAARLLRALADATRTSKRVPEGVAGWMTASLMPSLKPQTILEALGGPTTANASTIQWEDLEYRIDFAAAERSRLGRILSLISAPSLDAAIASKNPSALAAALLSLSYAIALGDPDGAVTLGRDIAARHDFGLGAIADPTDVTPWALPMEMQVEGRPWHVRGSLIGLDLGLARLSLRHLSDGEMPSAPTLTMNDYGTLAQTVVSMRPEEFRDDDRDELVAAIDRGRQRLMDAGHDLDRLSALAREVDLSPSTRNLLPWIASHEPQALRLLFSIRDLLWLGTPSLPADRLNQWGMFARALDGRLTRDMARARAWEHFAGRADTGLMATQVPDLTLRLAEETARMRLPAALIPALLSYAAQDFWYDVRARFADDWPAMIRQPLALLPERVEDYVAALAGTGLLRPRKDQQ